jgi:hypothetical protein
MDLLRVNPTEPGLIDHGVVILVPIQRLAALDTILGAHSEVALVFADLTGAVSE